MRRSTNPLGQSCGGVATGSRHLGEGQQQRPRKVGAAQIGSAQVRPQQIRIGQIGSAQVRPQQQGAAVVVTTSLGGDGGE